MLYKTKVEALCKECGRKDRKHKAFGLCTVCYWKMYKRSSRGSKGKEKIPTTPEVDR